MLLTWASTVTPFMLYILFVVWPIVAVPFIFTNKGDYERLQSTNQELAHKCMALTARCEAVERQLDDEAKNCRLLKVPSKYYFSDLGLCWSSIVSLMQGERDSFAFSKQELEKTLSKQVSQTDELERQLNEQAERCHILEVYNFNTACITSHLCTYIYILCIVLMCVM